MDKGNKPNKTESLTEEEIWIRSEKGTIGTHNLHALLNAVWLNNGTQFGLRRRRDHVKMLRKKCPTSDWKEYLESMIGFVSARTSQETNKKGKQRLLDPVPSTRGALPASSDMDVRKSKNNAIQVSSPRTVHSAPVSRTMRASNLSVARGQVINIMADSNHQDPIHSIQDPARDTTRKPTTQRGKHP
ncbi:unnamed protein product [Mytilus coruscus]|uniref:Uncharacterized protein n=1 Tax=Mytilus coruscus TaxID=42192 RepID=A0A6J8EXI7_MYTCO|nr:unnamed protein product [Mytilus coruscus]